MLGADGFGDEFGEGGLPPLEDISSLTAFDVTPLEPIKDAATKDDGGEKMETDEAAGEKGPTDAGANESPELGKVFTQRRVSHPRFARPICSKTSNYSRTRYLEPSHCLELKPISPGFTNALSNFFLFPLAVRDNGILLCSRSHLSRTRLSRTETHFPWNYHAIQ